MTFRTTFRLVFEPIFRGIDINTSGAAGVPPGDPPDPGADNVLTLAGEALTFAGEELTFEGA